MRTFNLFVSHSWAYGDQYRRLVRLLKARPYFRFNDYSIPENDPVHTRGSDKVLMSAIWNHMRPCHVVLVLAGLYASHSEWIDKEIKIAKGKFSARKPILAIEPRGSEKTSRIVKHNADEVVRWNTESIVSAIRKLA